MTLSTPQPWYPLLIVVGLLVSAKLWTRRAGNDPLLALLYIAGLVGAIVGAHLGYVLAEGYIHLGQPNALLKMFSGRTILGGLLGGYIAVELGKRLINYRSATGDVFAVIVPIALALGRIGCYLQGCCLGRACHSHAWYAVTDAAGIYRWPAPLAEAAFNLVGAAILWQLSCKRIATGQLFHIYLIAYGLMRFLHEFARDTPRTIGWLSAYQPLALALGVFGLWRFYQRAAARRAIPALPVGELMIKNV